MSNILINIPDLKKEYGGVYQYSIALLKILAEKRLPHDFFILCHDPDPAIIEIIKTYSNFHHPQLSKFSYSRRKMFIYNNLNRLFRRLKIKRRFYKKDLYDKLIEQFNIDIIHTPYQWNIKKPSIKSITTLHDVQELHFPEFFTSAQRAFRAVNYKKAIDEADAVIVSYDHIKNDIIKFFKKPEERVFTVLLDMQKLWFENIQNSDFEGIRVKYNLPSDFILLPASTWEHKNHLKLIEAIKHLNDPKIHLICTGNLTEHYYQQIQPYIEANNFLDQINFLGIITDEELLQLYRNCKAVVVPTLYEAGSFPLMESILLGVPVVCSNVTSLPDTIGDENFLFDPNNPKDIAEKIEKIWHDDSYREKNLNNSRIQSKKLMYNDAASKINKIYEDLTKDEI